MTRPLRIGVLAEGKTELGNSISNVIPQDGGKPICLEMEGALHTLIRRELELTGISECEFIQRHPSFKEQANNEIITGWTVAKIKYVKQTVSAWSAGNDVDLIVIVIDSDADIENRAQKIDAALQAVKESHFSPNDELVEGQNAGGLAIRNFETWLLADTESLTTLFGNNISKSVQEGLENLPTNSNDPLFSKNLFDSVFEDSDFKRDLKTSVRSMEARWELAKVINLSAIKTHCPTGYACFIDDLVPAAKNAVESMSINTD